MKICLYFIGKPRDPHANAMAEDYMRRVAHYGKAEMAELRGRADPWAKHPPARVICLDPAGRRMDSAAFTELIGKAETSATDLVFVIGGADGLSPEWRSKADLLISLSPMTLPHELARVVLAEQIYRAFATLRGHPYAR